MSTKKTYNVTNAQKKQGNTIKNKASETYKNTTKGILKTNNITDFAKKEKEVKSLSPKKVTFNDELQYYNDELQYYDAPQKNHNLDKENIHPKAKTDDEKIALHRNAINLAKEANSETLKIEQRFSRSVNELPMVSSKMDTMNSHYEEKKELHYNELSKNIEELINKYQNLIAQHLSHCQELVDLLPKLNKNLQQFTKSNKNTKQQLIEQIKETTNNIKKTVDNYLTTLEDIDNKTLEIDGLFKARKKQAEVSKDISLINETHNKNKEFQEKILGNFITQSRPKLLNTIINEREILEKQVKNLEKNKLSDKLINSIKNIVTKITKIRDILLIKTNKRHNSQPNTNDKPEKKIRTSLQNVQLETNANLEQKNNLSNKF